jgi:hypothetical protein
VRSKGRGKESRREEKRREEKRREEREGEGGEGGGTEQELRTPKTTVMPKMAMRRTIQSWL